MRPYCKRLNPKIELTKEFVIFGLSNRYGLVLPKIFPPVILRSKAMLFVMYILLCEVRCISWYFLSTLFSGML